MADNTVRGRFVWHELLTPNKAAAHDFYSKAVGWEKQAWEQDPSYTMFAAASGPLGASIESREDAPHWRPYIGTLDVDETVATATGLGAKVLTPPTSLPNAGRFAVLEDPHGAKVRRSLVADGAASRDAARLRRVLLARARDHGRSRRDVRLL